MLVHGPIGGSHADDRGIVTLSGRKQIGAGVTRTLQDFSIYSRSYDVTPS